MIPGVFVSGYCGSELSGQSHEKFGGILLSIQTEVDQRLTGLGLVVDGAY